MKLQKIHIFLILILSLIFACSLAPFLQSIMEGMTSKTTVTGKDGNSATIYKGPKGNKAVVSKKQYYSENYDSDDNNDEIQEFRETMYTGSGGNTLVSTSGNSVNGIPASHIPTGEEDLYILKSEVVPPVCPACPSSCPKAGAAAEKCPPCPPCERCPEPAFECKKVPNYNSANTDYLPKPVLNDFSQFGM